MLRLVMKTPAVLRVKSERLQERVQQLAELGDLTPLQVYKAYLGWPVLATTNTSLIKAR
jgi:hypothetical protein